MATGCPRMASHILVIKLGLLWGSVLCRPVLSKEVAAVCWTATSVLSTVLLCSLLPRAELPCLNTPGTCYLTGVFTPAFKSRAASPPVVIPQTEQRGLCSVCKASELLPIFLAKELSEASLVLLVPSRHPDTTRPPPP